MSKKSLFTYEDFKPFLFDENITSTWMEWLKEPNSHKGFVYAANRHVAIRVKADISKWDYREDSQLLEISKAFEWECPHPFDVAAISKAIDEIPRVEISLSGRVTYCKSTTDDKMVEVPFFEKVRPIELHGAHFDPDLLKIICDSIEGYSARNGISPEVMCGTFNYSKLVKDYPTLLVVKAGFADYLLMSLLKDENGRFSL